MIADDENEIGEAARRMSENYDFVVTRFVVKSGLLPPYCTDAYCSGGIGPTLVRQCYS